MTVLELKDVYYSYNKMTTVLDKINLSMESGKMYAILGPSGTGKTTLLSLAGGLDSPTKGEVIFDGEVINEKKLAAYRRDHVSFIFQSYNLIDYMNAKENVQLTARKDSLAALEQLGLTSSEVKRNVLKLSGGQQQRVAIARALAADAPLILADEPTGNLDEDTAFEITKILKECAHIMNKCVVIVTHSQEVAKEADVVFRLSRGEVKRYEKNKH